MKWKRTFRLRAHFACWLRLVWSSWFQFPGLWKSKIKYCRNLSWSRMSSHPLPLLSLHVSLVMTLVSQPAEKKVNPCTKAVEKWQRDEHKIRWTANHVRDKISLEKIMMISSKISFPLDAEHNGSFFHYTRAWNGNNKKNRKWNCENLDFLSLYLPNIDFQERIHTDQKFNSTVVWGNLFTHKSSLICRSFFFSSFTRVWGMPNIGAVQRLC